jgi:hypothetical protein
MTIKCVCLRAADRAGGLGRPRLCGVVVQAGDPGRGQFVVEGGAHRGLLGWPVTHDAGAEAAPRAARARSSATAATAAATAAPAAISVICQPAMPPTLTTRTVVAGTTRTGPSRHSWAS